MESHKSTFTIRARPEITNINNLKINTNTPTTVTVTGYGFWSNKKKLEMTTASFSGLETDQLEAPLFSKDEHEIVRAFVVPAHTDAFNVPVSAYDLYQPTVLPTDSSPTMTTKYPAFSGVEVTPSIINENELTIVIPAVVKETTLDIIISNRGGYGRASTDPNQSSDQTARFDTTLNISSSGMIVVEHS